MAKQNTYDVFISYRRIGGAEKAELVKSELIKRGFHESRIFLDTRSISSGNYLKAILQAVANSKNVVVVITKDCFNDLPSDSTWVHEIEYAIEMHKSIVPIYFDGITGIIVDDLPASIRSISFENAVLYVHPYADASFDRLASRLPKEPVILPKWSKWLIGAAIAGGLALGGYATINHFTSLRLGPGEVLVVDSPSAKSYHNSRDCITLKNAKHRIKKITEEEAIEQGKKPCKKCYKNQ